MGRTWYMIVWGSLVLTRLGIQWDTRVLNLVYLGVPERQTWYTREYPSDKRGILWGARVLDLVNCGVPQVLEQVNFGSPRY